MSSFDDRPGPGYRPNVEPPRGMGDDTVAYRPPVQPPNRVRDETLAYSPPAGEVARRPIDAARLWAGGVATAVVAALIGLVGVLIVRAITNVAFSGSRESGVFGDSSTTLLCVIAAIAALAATGLAHLLLLSTPRPLAYLGWICGLATVAAAVLPFLSGNPLPISLAQSVIRIVIGLAIGSLVSGAAASAIRSARRRYQP